MRDIESCLTRTSIRSNEHLRSIDEAYRVLLSHKDIVIIASEFSRPQATQNRQSTKKPSRPNMTEGRNLHMAPKDIRSTRRSVDTASKTYDTGSSHGHTEQPAQEPLINKTNAVENDDNGLQNPNGHGEYTEERIMDHGTLMDCRSKVIS